MRTPQDLQSKAALLTEKLKSLRDLILSYVCTYLHIKRGSKIFLKFQYQYFHFKHKKPWMRAQLPIYWRHLEAENCLDFLFPLPSFPFLQISKAPAVGIHLRVGGLVGLGLRGFFGCVGLDLVVCWFFFGVGVFRLFGFLFLGGGSCCFIWTLCPKWICKRDSWSFREKDYEHMQDKLGKCSTKEQTEKKVIFRVGCLHASVFLLFY